MSRQIATVSQHDDHGELALITTSLGSGAIESACRQYQCRFKPTGQFRTLTGDQALMCLETLNNRWHEFHPQAKSPNTLN